MGAMCLLKYIAVAASVQVGIIAIGILAHYKSVFLDIYLPWLWLGDQLFDSGGSGSHAMAGGAILGGLLGLVAYSILASVIICLFKARRRVP
jgi:hypothetical protein